MTTASAIAKRRTKRNFIIFFGAIMVGLFCLAWFVFEVQKQFVDERVNEASPFVVTATVPATGTSTPATEDAASSTTVAPVPAVTRLGTFIDRSHPAEGTASIVTDGTNTFLRFEEFKTDNGPDVFVYLARGVDRNSTESKLDDEIINLGQLKGNIGDQNYAVPSDVDLTQYDTVVLWCKRFGVAFGTADLAVQ
jgi:hypothetical protein